MAYRRTQEQASSRVPRLRVTLFQARGHPAQATARPALHHPYLDVRRPTKVSVEKYAITTMPSAMRYQPKGL